MRADNTSDGEYKKTKSQTLLRFACLYFSPGYLLQKNMYLGTSLFMSELMRYKKKRVVAARDSK